MEKFVHLLEEHKKIIYLHPSCIFPGKFKERGKGNESKRKTHLLPQPIEQSCSEIYVKEFA